MEKRQRTAAMAWHILTIIFYEEKSDSKLKKINKIKKSSAVLTKWTIFLQEKKEILPKCAGWSLKVPHKR